jgi:hypothetical protein
MQRLRDNSDFSFSADPKKPADEDFGYSAEQSEAADMFDAIIRQRFGELIAQAALRTRRGT